MNEYDNADKKQQDIIDDINDYNKQEIDLEPVYSEEGAEDNIAPLDLFEYEIINDGSVASSYMQNLPTKTARIKGIKPEYIDIQEISYNEWYYKITYDGITDVLVIPYEVELDENANVAENGEMYKITEVDLSIDGYQSWKMYYGTSFPSVKKVIYPNTVEKIERKYNGEMGYYRVHQPSEIILPKSLKSIGNEMFRDLSISNIEIPEGVTSIGDEAFSSSGISSIEIPESVVSIGDRVFYVSSIRNIKIPGSVKTIPNRAFQQCSFLENVEISEGVTSIGENAFSSCYSLNSILIPKSVKNISEGAFRGWDSNQTIYFECSEEESKNWDSNWNSYCDANIVWNYNPDGTTE